MRNILFLISIWSSTLISAQEIFAVDYASKADVKVFVVDYASRADLKVFKVDYSGQASGNEGLWYFAEYSGQADKTIFYVDFNSPCGLQNCNAGQPKTWKGAQTTPKPGCRSRPKDLIAGGPITQNVLWYR